MMRRGVRRSGVRRVAVPVAAAVAVGTMALAGCASSGDIDTTERDDDGAVVESGDVGVFRLRVGDCVELPQESDADIAGEIGVVTAVPCDEPHTGEVIVVDEQFFADLDEFPGQDAAFEAGDAGCTSSLDTYTGTDYQSSPFGFITFVPSERTWEDLDDRGLVCIGYTFDENFTGPIETLGSIRAD